MNLRHLKLALCAGEIACVVASLSAARAADLAMDKTGVGDLDRFAFWNSIVGLSVMLFFLLWVAAVLLAVFSRQREFYASKREYWMNLVPDVILPPLLMGAGWAAAFMLL